jgi:hypothetical protein
MNTRHKLGIGIPLTAILVFMLNGCVVAPTDPYYSGSQVVMVPPPPPRVEVYGAPPIAGYIWISGYWDWSNGQHIWRPGQWVPPRHGHRWTPHRWTQEGSQWRLHPGNWERD